MLLAALALGIRPGFAQLNTRSIPKPDYFAAFGSYYEGDYRTALKAFRNVNVLRTPNVWVDSVCVHAMAGECLFQMGEQALALEQFTLAVQIFVANPGWTQRVRFPDRIDPLQTTQLNLQPNWGVSARQVLYGNFPMRMEFMQGRVDNAAVLQTGGVVTPAEVRPVYVDEILRCTALAIRRRTQLLGVTAPYDPLSRSVLAAVQQPIVPSGHWSQCWAHCLIGLAQEAVGKPELAVKDLQRAISAGGRFDHPLTSTALIELGKLAYAAGDHRTAATSFYEATFPAAAYQQFDVIAEAFQWGLRNHQAAGGTGAYEPLPLAALWAQRKSRALLGWMQLSTAESLIAMGSASGAGSMLDQAQGTAARADMTSGVFGARMNYVVAQLAYLRGNAGAANRGLAAALAFQKLNSPRLFQITIADRLAASGSVTDQVAEQLYDRLLADPDANDWRHDPLDTFAYLLNPPGPAMLRWYAATLSRNQPAKALGVADQIRRRRFYSQLGLGGRLMALRWTLEAPEQLVPAQTLQQRKALRAAYPDLIDMSDRVAAVKAKLAAMPLTPEDEGQVKEQRKLLADLNGITSLQETLLGRIALSRAPSDFVFPPLRPLEAMQERLPEKTAMLVFFDAGGSLHGYLVSKESILSWSVGNTSKVLVYVRELLKRMGNLDKNSAASPEQLATADWREVGRALVKGLTFGLEKKPWEDHDHLIIVPDSVLWYVPFEALPIGEGDDEQMLIQKMQVRYAPLAALALPLEDWKQPAPEGARSAIYVGRLSPEDRPEGADATYEELAAVLTHPFRITKDTPAPGMAARLADQTIVMADLEQRSRSVFDWSPLSGDLSRAAGSMEDLLLLPFAAPRQWILPGFHTQAENGLKRVGDGSEIFLNACAMMAAGSRSILLSRWRVGGQTTKNLMKEFAQELPHVTASAAWSRAVQVTMENDVDLALEPRVKNEPTAQPLKASHPFFWSGYLLIDDGSEVGGGE